MEKPFPPPSQDTIKMNPNSSSKSLSRKVNSCKYLRPKSKKKSLIPSKISVKIPEAEDKPISMSPSRPGKQRNPSQDRFPLNVFSPLNLNASLKKPKKLKEVKTEKNKSGKKFTFEAEGPKKEEKNEEKKIKSKERDQARRLSIQGFKANETLKLGKSNDFKLSKNDLKPQEEEAPKDSVSRKSNRKVIDLNKTTKIEKKSKDFTKTSTKNEIFQEKLKKGMIEKSSRRIQEEIREKNTAEALEKLKKLTIGKKIKTKSKNLKEKAGLLKCIKKKRRKAEDLRPRIETSPKFIKNPEIMRKFKENRAAVIIQRWFRSLQRKFESYEESDSYHSNGLITEREEWVNFLDSKYSGSNSAFVEEFKAQILKNKVQVQKTLDFQELNKSVKSSSDSDGSTLIIDKQSFKAQVNEKKVNVPKLSLSMLKNSEFSEEEDDMNSKYLQDAPGDVNEVLDSDSGSYESVQLVERIENIHKAPKKGPNIKSLDLGKLKAYEDSEEQYSQSDEIIEHNNENSEQYDDSSYEFKGLMKNQEKCKPRSGINFGQSQDSDESDSENDWNYQGKIIGLSQAINWTKSTKDNEKQKSESNHSSDVKDKKISKNFYENGEIAKKQTIFQQKDEKTEKFNLKMEEIKPEPINQLKISEKNKKDSGNTEKNIESSGKQKENPEKILESPSKIFENPEKSCKILEKIEKQPKLTSQKLIEENNEKTMNTLKLSDKKDSKTTENKKPEEPNPDSNSFPQIKKATSPTDSKSSKISSKKPSKLESNSPKYPNLKFQCDSQANTTLKDPKSFIDFKSFQPSSNLPDSSTSEIPNPAETTSNQKLDQVPKPCVSLEPLQATPSKITIQPIKNDPSSCKEFSQSFHFSPESKVFPLEASDVFFTAIEEVRPVKIVASYKAVQIPERDSGEKASEQSPYDLLQTSFFNPVDLQSPQLSSRSENLEKNSETLKSKSRSPSLSPQLSPRFSETISSFSMKSPENEKTSKNKNFFNSKLFENNGEPLSERARKFMSSIVNKVNELHEEVLEKSEKNKSLIVQNEKNEKIQDVFEKELKIIKSPRRDECKGEGFKSFNLNDEISVKPKSSSHILLEDLPEIIQKLINSEIYSFLRLIPFKDSEREVDSSIEFIVEYLELMSKELKQTEEDVLDAINTPAYQEPLHKLTLIQDFSTILSKFPTLELILPPDLCSELKVLFHSLELPSRQIYLQMLFDCVNEALNYIRPFGVDGIPDPWSSKARILFGEAELSNVFTRIIAFMVKWASCKAGLFHCPESRGEDDRLLFLREEKMSSLLCMDVRDEEGTWLRYEEEETQIKIMTTNSIFESLIDEIITIINN